jgi:poly(A) polymerase
MGIAQHLIRQLPLQAISIDRQGMTAELPTPNILVRAEHPVSRKQISKNALRVLYKLLNDGHEAYLVGGGVRDLLLGREPKDFDIATSAHPEVVRALFRGHCRLIGRRFVLAHVFFGAEILEVATFRALGEGSGRRAHTQEGRLVSDNVYGTLPEDALRRDFTINALYYNPHDFTVLDFSTGVEDLKLGLLRIIGDPVTRCREDPVRMLRAVRFAAKLGFAIEAECGASLHELASLLHGVPPARLYEEVLKLFLYGFALEAFEKLRHYRLFGQLFPQTEASLTQETDHFPLTFLVQALQATDARISAAKSVSPVFLFATLLWEPVRQAAGEISLKALLAAIDPVLNQQNRCVAIPWRLLDQVRTIWLLQTRFSERQSKQPLRLLSHPGFRPAYDFFCLRAAAGEVEPALAQWWQHFVTAQGIAAHTALPPPGEATPAPTRKPHRKPRSGETATPPSPQPDAAQDSLE